MILLHDFLIASNKKTNCFTKLQILVDYKIFIQEEVA